MHFVFDIRRFRRHCRSMTGDVCLEVALVINLRDHVAHAQRTTTAIRFVLDWTNHHTIVDQELLAERSYSQSVYIRNENQDANIPNFCNCITSAASHSLINSCNRFTACGRSVLKLSCL